MLTNIDILLEVIKNYFSIEFLLLNLLYIIINKLIFNCNFIKLTFLVISNIFLGIILSYSFIRFNVTLYVDIYMCICIVLYLILMTINSKYMCLAYVYPIYASLIEILNLDIYTNIDSYIYLIGIIHLIEGINVFILSKLKLDLYITNRLYDYDNKTRRIVLKKIKTFYGFVPLTLPIAVNLHTQELIRSLNTVAQSSELIYKYFDIITLLFFTFSYQYIDKSYYLAIESNGMKIREEKIKKPRKLYDAFLIILYSITIFFIFAIVRLNLELSYVGLTLVVLLHEMFLKYKY